MISKATPGASWLEALDKDSSGAWKILVYAPARENYVEMAKIYEAVTILTVAKIRPYIELVLRVATNLLRSKPLKGIRIEKAMLVMLRKELDISLDKDGVVYCPDIVTRALAQDVLADPRSREAVIQALPRFTETKADDTGPSVRGAYWRTLSGIVLVVISYLFGVLVSTVCFPGDLSTSLWFRYASVLIPFVPILWLGYPLRSNEFNLFLFFCSTLFFGGLAYQLCLRMPWRGGPGVITLCAFYLLGTIFFLFTATEYYRWRAVKSFLRKHLSSSTEKDITQSVPQDEKPRETKGDDPFTINRALNGLNFRGLARGYVWFEPLVRRIRFLVARTSKESNSLKKLFLRVRESSLLTAGLLLSVFSVLFVLLVDWGMRDRWIGLCAIAFGLVGCVTAYLRRPYRCWGESLVLMGGTFTVYVTVLNSWNIPVKSLVSLAVPFVSVWVLFIAFTFASRASLARGSPQADPASLFSWEPLRPSEPFRPSTILGTQALAYLVWGAVAMLLLAKAIEWRADPEALRYKFAIWGSAGFGRSIQEQKFARQTFAKLLQIFPDWSRLHYLVGCAAFAEGDWEGAADHLQLAVNKLKKKERAKKFLCSAAYMAGRDDLALDTIQSVLAGNRKDHEITLIYLGLLFAQGRYDECRTNALQVVGQGRDYARAWHWVASSLIEQGKEAQFEEFSKSTKRDPLLVMAEARCARVNGNIPKAISNFERVRWMKDAGALERTASKENLIILKAGDKQPPKSGALVVSVSPYGAAAASKEFRPGDVLYAVEGKPIRNLADVNRLRIAFKKQDHVTWNIWRMGEPVAVTTRPTALQIRLIDF